MYLIYKAGISRFERQRKLGFPADTSKIRRKRHLALCAWMALFGPTLLLVPNRRDASIRFRINLPKQQISQPIKPPKLIDKTSGDTHLQLLI